VTADGERKIVDACSEPDLYWALRGGGGGSFGVVTSLYYRRRRWCRAATPGVAYTSKGGGRNVCRNIVIKWRLDDDGKDYGRIDRSSPSRARS